MNGKNQKNKETIEITTMKALYGQKKGQRDDLKEPYTNNGKGHSTMEIIAKKVNISKNRNL